MSTPLFRVVPFDGKHSRTTFDSGSEPLNRYFREQVTQDIRRKVTACFVALHEKHIAGYYTLASSSLLLNDLPPTLCKKLPRYPTVPAVRMGRLAVDKTFQGQGLGGALLADALTRVVNSEIAAYALVVDAKDERAVSFYKHYGFVPLSTLSMTYFLPLEFASVFCKNISS